MLAATHPRLAPLMANELHGEGAGHSYGLRARAPFRATAKVARARVRHLCAHHGAGVLVERGGGTPIVRAAGGTCAPTAPGSPDGWYPNGLRVDDAGAWPDAPVRATWNAGCRARRSRPISSWWGSKRLSSWKSKRMPVRTAVGAHTGVVADRQPKRCPSERARAPGGRITHARPHQGLVGRQPRQGVDKRYA